MYAMRTWGRNRCRKRKHKGEWMQGGNGLDEQQFLPEQEIEGKMEGEMKREGGRGEEVIEMEGGLSE